MILERKRRLPKAAPPYLHVDGQGVWPLSQLKRWTCLLGRTEKYGCFGVL